MKCMTAGTRISIGLVCSMLGVLTVAHFLGLLPDRERLEVRHRVQVAKTIAVSAAAMIVDGDLTGVEEVLQKIVGRRPELLSAGVRSREHGLLIDVGNHAKYWIAEATDPPNDAFITVSLAGLDNSNRGQIEFRWSPVQPRGFLAPVRTQFFMLLLFCAPLGFLTFRASLRVVLRNLDSSTVVPRRVQEALDILTEGLMIVGLDDRILLANEALASMTSHDTNAMLGRRASSLGFRRCDGGHGLPWRDILHNAKPQDNVTMQLDGRNGSVRIFNVNCSSLMGSEAKNRGVMVTFDDVTQLERNKIELRTARDEAESANRAKSDFLANMSHEIRNPINAIVGFTDVLRRGLEHSEQNRIEYLNTIHSSGTHLVALINDILDLSKIEADMMELECCPCSPCEILAEVVRVMQVRAKEQDLRLEYEIRGSVPETIHSDPTRLRQVLMNLVGNAIKFTERGSVRIVAEALTRARNPQMKFEVIDTGIGMIKQQCAKIFDEFVQADSSVTGRFGGTGLGLAISRRLTQALGGDITVDSKPGVGTTFSFTVDTGSLSGIPMLTGDQVLAVLRQKETSERARLHMTFKPARVLVTDDTPANRQLIRLVLDRAGLTVDEAENGLEAVRKATETPYDLLLMDMQMPVMDGLAATVQLRKARMKQPIIALTANVMQGDRERCEQAGCSAFLTKPIDRDRLLETLADFLPFSDEPPPSVNSGRQAVPKRSTEPERASSPVRVEVLGETGQHASPVREPVRSTLPLEISEFRKIVEQFVAGLDPMLEEMNRAWADRDFRSLRDLAHRLKGTGGTVGFAAFTVPSGALQERAEREVEDDVEDLLRELQELSSAIHLS